MKTDARFEEIDKAALVSALVALGVCPQCRREDLRPGYTGKGMERDNSISCCVSCDKSWPAPLKSAGQSSR